MTRLCEITGKRPMSGNRVSHANNKNRRVFRPNLMRRRLWSESRNRWVTLKISSAALRTIDKKGLDAVLGEMEAKGKA